jgi:hypothetical protein
VPSVIVCSAWPKREARQHEERERTADGDDEQRGGCVAEHQVLEHVGREQVLLGRPVERGDDSERRERDPGEEEESPPQTCVVLCDHGVAAARTLGRRARARGRPR